MSMMQPYTVAHQIELGFQSTNEEKINDRCDAVESFLTN